MTAIRTTCPYCGVGCGLAVTRHGEQIEIAGDPSHPANLGRVCSKGAALGETLGAEGRLLHPQIGGQRTDWTTAIAAVADGFSRVIAEHGPDSVAFYVSGQLLTEDYYVANKLMKGFIGSANIDTNSRLCMASAVAGHKRAFGADFVPCSYADIEVADLVVLVGSNAAWCHPVLFQRIARAREEHGARVVVIDPRRTPTCEIADLHLKLRPGTDVALFNGLLAHLVATGATDDAFVAERTEGIAAAQAVALAEAPTAQAVAALCDLPARDVAAFYAWFAGTPRVLTLFSQGVNQSSAGTDKVNAIINAHLATGRIGKPGAGPFSLTGQPNAMGGREVGGLANQLAAHMDFTPEAIDRVARFWNAPRIARRPGLKAVDLFAAIGARRIRAVWVMGTNPAVSLPDADRVRRALRACDLVVVSDCVRDTDTAALAHVLLPAAAWGEKSGTVTNSERRISRQRAFLPAPGESRPDWWIVCEVARRLGFEAAFDFRGPADIFREHARLSAFENDGGRAFDIGGLATVDDAEYDALEPQRWPVRRAPQAGCPARQFFTTSGRACAIATPIRRPDAAAEGEGRFVLNTGRARDHWHTLTRTGRSARLSQRHPEPFVQIHPHDAAALGIIEGDLAELSSSLGRMLARVEITASVRAGEVFAPMHWNDQFALHGAVGRLIPAVTDPVSGQPELKLSTARVRRYTPAWYAFLLSRDPLEIDGVTYRVAVRGSGHWRYELAGELAPASWATWSRRVCGSGHDWLEFEDRALGRYRAAALENGRLIASIFVGSRPMLAGREALAKAFSGQAIDDMQRIALLAGCAGTAGPERGGIVCSCFGVDRKSLVEAIRTRQLASTREIGRALRAGTSCGSCLPELEALLQAAGREAVGA